MLKIFLTAVNSGFQIILLTCQASPEPSFLEQHIEVAAADGATRLDSTPFREHVRQSLQEPDLASEESPAVSPSGEIGKSQKGVQKVGGKILPHQPAGHVLEV